MSQKTGWDAIDLSPWLAEIGGTLADARELSGGASKDIWLVQVALATGETRPYVLRRAALRLAEGALDIAAEAAVMRAAFDAGVKVPEPVYQAEDAEGRAFIVMPFHDGETLGSRLFRQGQYADTRSIMAAELGACLAPVHGIAPTPELEAALGPRPEPGVHPGRQALALFEAVYHAVARNPHPVFDLAFRHLSHTLPEASAVCVVHGDYRLGNVIYGPEGIRTILDWELAHWGDPMEDIGWVTVRAWRFGHDAHPVAGCGPRRQLWDAYAAAGGQTVDPDRAHWWELYGNLRWGVITLMQAVHFLDGTTCDLEKAAIGRRAAEVEGELLHLLTA